MTFFIYAGVEGYPTHHFLCVSYVFWGIVEVQRFRHMQFDVPVVPKNDHAVL